jgi:N6-L-threonylcarbamoyladenine synthase
MLVAVLPADLWRINCRTMTKATTILGLESSCDDTAAAVLRHRPGELPEILSAAVWGQDALHASFGGVVPEIAARAHAEKIDLAVEQALDQSGLTLPEIDLIAVTAGPGLIGGVLSGVMCAKGIAAALGKPLIGVNHLAGHALSPRIMEPVAFPYLMLLVSGGHCQFLIVHAPDRYTRLGGTIDDAPGEAFDKVARILGLPAPGGPSVEQAARHGTARFDLPRPLIDRPGMDLSFSGLKTAVTLLAADQTHDGEMTAQTQSDIAASFQEAVADILTRKSRRAIEAYLCENPAEPVFAVAGGVAANQTLRAALTGLAAQTDCRFVAPPMALCTDNAVMIASAGGELFALGHRDGLDLSARPRWPLDDTAEPMLGSGKKGAKA